MSKKHARRKSEQLEIALRNRLEPFKSRAFDDIHLIHHSLPEIDLKEVDPSTEFLGYSLKYPFIISALTGGCEEGGKINELLARAANHFSIGMEIGSERVLLQSEELSWTYTITRKVAPNILLLANIGAPQLLENKNKERIQRLVDVIEASALVIHLNFLQEAVMVDGEPKARGCLKAIEDLVSSLSVPIIVKETGAGISRELVSKLKDIGVYAIDIGGASGTSMALLESIRAKKRKNWKYEMLAKDFAEWGIPTPISLIGARDCGILIIASGGIRTGLDAAKAIALGAHLVGVGRPLLEWASKGYDLLIDFLDLFFSELKVAMFLSGSLNLDDLRKRDIIITGKTREYLQGIGYGRGVP